MVWSQRPTDEMCKQAFDAVNQYPTLAMAARALGLSISGLKGRIAMHKKRLTEAGKEVTPSPKLEPPLELSERYRLISEIDKLRGTCTQLVKKLSEAEEHRASILKIAQQPQEPAATLKTDKSSKHGQQGVVLHLSDLHFGEVVNRDEVMGVNEYTLDIARKRTARLFNTVAILVTSAWPASDPPPAKINILLGGDLVSGHGLHPDHAETDAGTAYQQVKWAADAICHGVIHLREQIKEHFKKSIPIEIISVGGNHGRMTFGKPRSKQVSIQSYDTLVSDFVESGLRTQAGVLHSRPRGFDAYFDVVGWPCLLTHGDRMGAGGGMGFIGPMATIIKGHRKIIDTEHRQRRPVFKVFSGHFHTTGVTSFGFANGSGVGYGEFAKSIRADPEPAMQNFVVFHERLGVLRWHPIHVGDPSEGSIYQPNGGLILPTVEK